MPGMEADSSVVEDSETVPPSTNLRSFPLDGETVPVELFQPIIAHLDAEEDRSALVSLLYTNKTLSSEAEKRLYHTVKLCTSLNQNRRFLETIVNSPRLAHYVVEYYIGYNANQGYASMLFQWLLRDCLRAFVNLTTFSYSVYQDRIVVISDLLTGCQFRLKRLIWDRPRDEELLAEFLKTQPDLEELLVDWSNKMTGFISQDMCPRLSYLCGNLGAIEAFLPGRNVTRVKWRYSGRLDYVSGDLSLDHLEEPLGRVETLRLAGDQDRPPLSLFSHLLPAVTVLEICMPTVSRSLLRPF